MLTEETDCDGPLVVGLGGTLRANSSTERALRHCLAAVERQGGRTKLYCGQDIELPMYNPPEPARTPEAIQLTGGRPGADSGCGKTPSTTTKICVTTPASTSTTNRGAASAVLTGGRRRSARWTSSAPSVMRGGPGPLPSAPRSTPHP